MLICIFSGVLQEYLQQGAEQTDYLAVYEANQGYFNVPYKSIKNSQHTLEFLSVYQYELDLSKEVLYVFVEQRAAKLQMIKVFKAAFLRSYVQGDY